MVDFSGDRELVELYLDVLTLLKEVQEKINILKVDNENLRAENSELRRMLNRGKSG